MFLRIWSCSFSGSHLDVRMAFLCACTCSSTECWMWFILVCFPSSDRNAAHSFDMVELGEKIRMLSDSWQSLFKESDALQQRTETITAVSLTIIFWLNFFRNIPFVIDRLIDLLFKSSLINQSINDRLIDWMIDWLFDFWWYISSLIDRLIDWLIISDNVVYVILGTGYFVETMWSCTTKDGRSPHGAG